MISYFGLYVNMLRNFICLRPRFSGSICAINEVETDAECHSCDAGL